MKLIQNIFRRFRTNPDRREVSLGNGRNLLSNAAILLGASLLLASCSDEVLTNGNEGTNGAGTSAEKFYISLNINPTAKTRLSEDDTSTNYPNKMEKPGEDYENEIINMAVILANPDTDEPYMTIPLETEAITEKKTYKGVGEVDMTVPQFKAMKDNATGDVLPVKLFVVCNYEGEAPSSPSEVMKIASLADIDKYGKKNGKFLMTNGDYLYDGSSPTQYVFNFNFKNAIPHTTKENPYNITPKTSESVADDNETDRVKINVQRALARIDMAINNTTYYFSRDGEFVGDTKNGYTGPWTTSVVLEFVGIVNVNKNFYLFKQTGPKTGTSSSYNDNNYDWTYFGSEMPATGDNARFVRDPEYAAKTRNLSSGATSQSLYRSYLFDPDTFRDESFDTYDEEDYENVFFLYNGSLGIEKDGYRIWTYVTPNTIHEPENQKVSISTGVIFVGKMNFSGGMGGDSEGTLRNYAHNYHGETTYNVYDPTPTYFWSGTPVGTNRELQKVVNNPKDARERAISEAYKAAIEAYKSNTGKTISSPTTYEGWVDLWETEEGVKKPVWADFTNFTDWAFSEPEPYQIVDGTPEGELNQDWLDWLPKTKDGVSNQVRKNRRFEVFNTLPSRELATELLANKFAIYTPSDPQNNGAAEYMCYYYGWIRHNNNKQMDVMGPMEFGVVRNNIYQVSVTEIRHIGHPFLNPDVDVDPEPPTPLEDDEPLDPYIKLTFEVCDWNVVVNSNIGLGH
ncbi:MAG: Mfa1 fimbrilin C-terminal domain-containing protein [Muribaculaceae bacterium]|nr:Mfa1 fimbrilin C-terminal domain-containing protein [Muribaculaceae bacterium]